MPDFNEDEYFVRKTYWEEIFNNLAPRDATHEEYCAFVNALEDRNDDYV